MIGPMAERLISPVFIGRRRQLAAAMSAFERTVGGRSSHLLVVGEAGIGKTRFIDEVAALATDRGAIVIRGSCRAAGDGGVPYAPIAEGLRDNTKALLKTNVTSWETGHAHTDI